MPQKLNKKKEMNSIVIMAQTPPPYGGGEIMNEIMVKGLRNKNIYQIVHIDMSDKRGNANRGKFDFINIGKSLLDLCRLFIALIKFQPSIVYIPVSKYYQGFIRDSLYILLSSFFRTKIIGHLHGGYFTLNKGNFVKKNLTNYILKKIDILIVLGEKIKRRLKTQIPIESYFVIYNGINPILSESSSPYEIQQDNFNMIFIGNLKKSKGLFDILKAFSLIQEKTDHIELLIAGEWASNKDKKIIINYIAENKLEKFIKFWGLVTKDRKIEFFRKGDVLVHPTYYDGQPIVILEAMSAGLPIITTDVGSIAETVIHQENGFIIPEGRPDLIAEKVLLLYENRTLYMDMSCMSKRLFNARFTKEVFLEKMNDLFTKVLSESKSQLRSHL